MTKKEFKEKCKKEKTKNYKLMVAGGTFSIAGLLIVLAGLFLTNDFAQQITMYVVAIILAVIGMTLDIIGEVGIAKEYKEQTNK